MRSARQTDGTVAFSTKGAGVRRLLVIASVLFLSACYNAPDPGKTAAAAGPARSPARPRNRSTCARTDGRTDSLARHRGQVVLLNLWATWCPPCNEEMPALQRFARENAGKVVVLGVDQGESAAAARRTRASTA